MIKIIFILIIFQSCYIHAFGNDTIFEQVIELSEDTDSVICLPEVINIVEAVYPSDIKRLGIEGIVRVRLLIAEDGTVEECKIIEPLHPVLDSNSCKATRQLRFKPALTNDGPVAVELDYEYVFSLKKSIENIKPVINIRGQLIERGTRAPVGYATISVHCINPQSDTTIQIPYEKYLKHIGSFEDQHIEENFLITTSDSSGFFSFYSIPACSTEISIFCNGYKPLITKEIIRPDSVLSVKYLLIRDSYNDYEIVTYGRVEKKEVSSHRISKSEVSGVAGVAGDAVKVVQTLPGVARPNFTDGDMCLRGSDAFDSEILLEGLMFYIPFHMGSYKSSYNSDAVESVEYLPGGFSVRYGNSVGGIMNLTGRSGRGDRLGGSLDCNLVDGTLFIEGPLSKKTSFLGSLRASYLHKMFNIVYDNCDLNLPYYLSPKYRDALLRVDIKPNKNNHIFLTSGFFDSGIDFIYPSVRGGNASDKAAKDRFDGEWKWYTIIAGWDLVLNKNCKNSFYFNKCGEKENFNGFGMYKWIDAEGGIFFRDELSLTLKENITSSIGITGQYYKIKGSILIPDFFSNILSDYELNEKSFLFALYALFDIKIGNKLTITPGIRYDYWNIKNHKGTCVPEFWNYKIINNKNRFSGDPSLRVNMRYLLGNNHTLKAAIGNYSQYPQPWFSISDLFGNPNLTSTKASHYVLGYEYIFRDFLNVDLQVYYNKQWDKTRETTLLEQNNGLPSFIDDGKAKIYGMELLLRCNRIRNFFGWLSYTLSKSDRFDYEQNKYVPFEKDQTNNITAVGTWHLPKNIECGVRMQYTTGNPATPVTGSKYDETSLSYQKIMGAKNSTRLPPSFQIHLRFGKKFTMKNWILTSYIDIFNASYLLYQSPQDYIYNYDPYDYTTGKSDKMQISELIIPSLGIKAEF